MARDFWNSSLRSDASTAIRNLSGIELAMAPGTRAFCRAPSYTPQHFLYLRPLPQGHSSLRPTLGVLRLPRKSDLYAASGAIGSAIEVVAASMSSLCNQGDDSLRPKRSSAVPGARHNPNQQLAFCAYLRRTQWECNFSAATGIASAVQWTVKPLLSGNIIVKSCSSPSWADLRACRSIMRLMSRNASPLSSSSWKP